MRPDALIFFFCLNLCLFNVLVTRVDVKSSLFCSYVPQEEVPLYESKGKQLEKNQPKYPVGLSEEYIREAQQRREMAQKKANDSSQATTNQKKKKKKSQNDVVKVVPADDLLQTSSYIGVEQVRNKNDEWTTVTTKGKTAAVPKEEIKPVPKPINKPKEKKQPEVTTEPAKRVRNLKKKLKEIEQIEEKRSKGAKLEKDQLDKLSRKGDVEEEISRLVSEFELS